MNELPPSGPPPSSEHTPDDRLDSWKEIAAYMRRDVTTVQRWEKREGMPVHRHVHDKRGSVYAFAAELDTWRESRRLALEANAPVEPAEADREARQSTEAASAPSARQRSWWVAAGVGLIALLAGLVT